MKFKTAEAQIIADKIMSELKGACEEIALTGQILTNPKHIEHLEVTYVPRMENRRLGVFGRTDVNLAEEKIHWLLRNNFWNADSIWGTKLKIAIHRESGIPVHLTAVSAEALK